MPKFVSSDRSQPYLLPPDMRDWVPEDDLVHFVLEAVERVSMSRFRVNERGTGSAQCHPRMMLALLVYCCANGMFGSRRIERATHRDLCVRYLTADRHPDHDTICKFRRENLEAVSEAFVQVLLLAKELRLLRVGTVSVDGTKVDANANLRNGIRHDRAEELRAQLQGEIDGLLAEAERADAEESPDPQRLPAELSRREALKAKLDRACAELKARAERRAESEREEYERKVAARDAREGSAKGRPPKPPSGEPRPEDQVNLTDADSGLMKKSERHEWRQSYNAQAVVDADGSQLVLGCRVSRSANDRRELVADMDAVPSALGTAECALADNGYATGSEVAELQGRGMEVLVATGAEGRRRRHDFRPEPESAPPPNCVMRQRRITQLSLFHPCAVDHRVGDDLERMSSWLDAHPELVEEVASDLGGSPAGVGRRGLSCETVLRCALLKHLRQETFRGLEFLLRDSRSAQRFARVDALRPPGKSALQATVGSIRSETWERINGLLLSAARSSGVESGDRVRVDSTVTRTNVLEPSDSGLLWDGVRVLTRLLVQARDALGAETVPFRDHRRAAKRRALEVRTQRGAERRAQTYRRLLRIVKRTRGYASAALAAVAEAGEGEACWQAWRRRVEECDALLGRVVERPGAGCWAARRCRRGRRS